MASKLSTAQQTVILALGRGDEITQFHYYKASWYIRNGVASRDQLLNKGTVIKLTSLGFVMIINEARENKLVLTPDGQQEYERLFPAPQDTVDSMLAFIADRPRSADVFQPSGLAILDGLVAEGKATLTNGYYEATKAPPADRQPATSEPAADVTFDDLKAIVNLSDYLEITLNHDNVDNYDVYHEYHDESGKFRVITENFSVPEMSAHAQVWLGEQLEKMEHPRIDFWKNRPQSPVASQPAESETAGDNSLDGAGMTYSLETQLDTVKYDLQLAEEEISRLQAALADAREQLDAANRKLAAIRHEDMEAIGDMVYGGQSADDERKVYVERSGRPDADDDLLTLPDVRTLFIGD